MANSKKFLLGRGELLTGTIEASRSGRPKNPPYDLKTAISRFSKMLHGVSNDFAGLPDDACPNDKVVIQMTMHPRYISKSDYPSDLLALGGMRAIGGKSVYVEPDKWGVDKHPEGSMTDSWYASTTRASLLGFMDQLEGGQFDDEKWACVQSVENIVAPGRIDKIKTPGIESTSHLYEVVLHSDGSPDVVDAFYQFLEARHVIPVKRRVKFSGGVVFVPIEAGKGVIEELADFSFLRAIRPMPRIRMFRPPVLRSDFIAIPDLPEEGKVLSDTRVAIFDGGLPKGSPLESWVDYIEPAGIGDADTGALDHGEQVTSAFLFGHMTPESKLTAPFANVDHVRVIDENTGHNNDFELYDVLERILNHLDGAEEHYEYVNLSLGPDIPVDDDDITLWTSELDKRASDERILISVAAGNTGENDAASQLNRIQPPSDGVNLLAVGACDSMDLGWSRSPYSSVGPGRAPGVAKPDGVAFGGVFERPFGVINTSSGGLNGTLGTSFSAPFVLRTAVGVQALSGDELSPLGIRALLVHHADNNGLPAEEVGWGRFKSDPLSLMSCEEDEVTVVYQGGLPLKEYLHAPIPLPRDALVGMVSITATLVIAPDVDPAFAHAYTRAGLEVVFRPNINNKATDKSKYAKSDTFFSEKNLYKAAEYKLRSDGHKWEPCWKVTKSKRGALLDEPCFDIYFHNRHEGHADAEPHPIPYALVVTVKAPKVKNLYEDTLKIYSDVLLPIEPMIEIPVIVES